MIEYDRDQIDPDRDEYMDVAEHDEGLAAAKPSGAPARRELSRRQAELPTPIYRLLILHSSETLFAHFEHAGDPPHFRTMAQLDAALEGPIAEPHETAEPVGAHETAELVEPHGMPEAGEPGIVGEPGEPAAEHAVDEAPGASAEPAAESVPAAAASVTAPATASPAFTIPDRAIVVAPTRYGRDLCEVQGVVQDLSVVNPDEVASIEKPAGLDELRKHKANLEREAKAYVLCRQKIWTRNLPMKLVSAHYMLDEPKILFYFSAETRVDFRELVKDLVSVFKMRIELRQIGVRDEARVTGGCGVCGRILCCRGVSDKLNPVSIKMAKDQNLSLNSLKISGPCGRLLCCLAYEYQFYRDARRELPNEGARFHYDGTQFRVMEVIPLSGSVKMAGEDGRMLVMKSENFAMVDGRWQIKE